MSSETPSGPDGIPVLGNVLESIRTPMEFRKQCMNRHDGIVNVNLAGTTMYMLTDPEYIEQVLVTQDEHFVKPTEMREQLVGVFGDGLLLSENEFWREQRGTINPAFHPKKIQSYTGTIIAFTERLVDGWDDAETFDMRWEMDRLALQIVMKTLFGVDFDGNEGDILTPIKQINKRYKPSNLSSYLPAWTPTKVNRTYREGKVTLAQQVEQLIEQHREMDTQPDNLLTRLLDATDDETHQMTPEILREEITTLALGASGPVGLALTYTCYLIARNERVSQKLTEEIETTLDGSSVTMGDIPKLTYTKKVIQEVLRLYPPVWSILREPEIDVKVGEYPVPEGTPLSMTPWTIHRNEEFFENPDEFRPERWTDDFEEELPDYVYIPFGAGPRTCIGKQFALKEMQVAVPTIFQQYEMEYVPNEPMEFSVAHILEPAGNVEMTVSKRE